VSAGSQIRARTIRMQLGPYGSCMQLTRLLAGHAGSDAVGISVMAVPPASASDR
jgi:hypothetical protein